MKRIAIFCDGTWGGRETGRQTHITRLAHSVMPVASDHRTQLVYYQPGVGAGNNGSYLGRTVDKWAGGLLGWGLNRNLEDAYRQLIFWYEPGDEIYIFGYSRGAYLARSLVGLIRLAGIPPADNADGVGRAIRAYRDRDRAMGPDNPRNLQFRNVLSPQTATSRADLAWRAGQGNRQSYFLRVRFLGVWDTVGTLGLPGLPGGLAGLLNRRFAFHDTTLSNVVLSARHAVAIDERRKLFPPTLWKNLDALNIEAGADAKPYRQVWFPGNHGIIGGLGNVPELSAYPTNWVIDGARKLGLHFDRTFLDELSNQAQADVPVPRGFDPRRPRAKALRKLLLADREGLKDIRNISQAAKERVNACPDYRPKVLEPFLNDLSRDTRIAKR